MTKAIKKRHPVLTLVLSLLVPGLGQFYSGRGKRAGVLYGVGPGVSLLFFLLFYRWFYGLVGYLGFLVFYYLFSAGDAFFISRREPEIELLRFQRWYWYCCFVLLHLFVLGLMLFVVSPLKPYKVASDSMARTILPGDYFLVDKRAYHKRIPERGDIIIFGLPANPKRDYVKRVLGVPGDNILIEDYRLVCNGNLIEEPYRNKNLQINTRFNHYGPVKIPENHIFVLGDNRPFSSDSRQFGPVSAELIKGKVLYLILAKDKKRIGVFF